MTMLTVLMVMTLLLLMINMKLLLGKDNELLNYTDRKEK